MANNPTIVAASLSDQTLKDSINKLVNEVNSSVNSMAENFNTAIGSMETKLKNLGRIDLGGSTSGGGTKKVVSDQKQLEEQTKKTTQAVTEQAYTYDQLAEYMKKAAAQAEKRYAVTDIQQLRMRQHEIAAELNKLEGTKLGEAIDKFQKLQEKADEAKRRIAELQGLMSQFRTGEQKAAAAQEIENLRTQIVLLNGEMKRIQPTGGAEQRINSLRLEYEAIGRKILEMAQELINAEQKETSLTNASRQQTVELDKQLQKIKELNTLKDAKAMFVSIADMPMNTLEEARAKVAAIRALMQKVENTPLMGKIDFEKLLNQFYAANEAVRQFTADSSTAAEKETSTTKIIVKSEQERREEILKTGQAAQETFRKLQGTEYDVGKPIAIENVRELRAAIEDMSRAYYSMSNTERDSAIGIALKRDIENARKLDEAIKQYNSSLMMKSSSNDNLVTNESTLRNLRSTLKQLTSQYENLSVAEINAGKGDQIIQHFQDVNRAAQIVQRTLNRPLNLKAAMAGDERTIDEITYKIQKLQSYRNGINFTDPKQAAEAQIVDKEIVRLNNDLNKYMSTTEQVVKGNNALTRSWNYMKNRLAFYFTVGASTQFIKNLIEVRSQYEMNERALGILISSAERGTQIFKELSDMALVSPYTLIELSSAAKQLTAYDVAAKNVVDTTRRLADMASAVGVPMERLTYALGQIKAYGYLNSRDARMFANAGIPLVRELSKYYSELEGRVVSVGDVYDRMKKKAIDFNSVMAVVTKMTDEGGKFFDFQAKMADTLKVRLANLTLAWNNMLNEMGQNTQGVLTSGIGALRDLFLHWKDIETAVQKVIWALGLWKAAQAVGLIMIGELNTKMGAQVLLGKKLGTTLASAASSTKSFVSGYAMAASALLMVIADIIVTSQRNAEEIQRLNKTIADGAKEASDAMYNFIHSTEMVSARMSAMQGKLSATDATKTWEALREQIELSAMSNKQLIDQLLLIPDMNKRVSEAFTLAESIQEATNKLIGLDNELKVTQDSILWGLFGEGLAEDIDDFNARLEKSAATEKLYFESTGSLVGDVIEGFKGFFSDMKEKLGSSREEAEREIRNFAVNAAEAIREQLGEEGLRDKVQINEAIARALQAVEQTFPQIRGKGKVLFETMFNDIMATEFEGSVDRQAYYYNKFLEQLKKDHGSAFGDVTDEVLKDTHQWSSAQMDAIEKTAEKVKKDLPAASQDAIDEILRQLNSTEFKVRIVTEMATTSVGEVEEQFNEKFIKKPWIADQKEREKAEAEAAQKYGNLRRKSTESNVEYEKRISDERKKQLELSQKNADIISANKNNQDEYSKAVVKDAEKAKESADAWLKAANEVEKAGGYDFSTKSERSAASKAQKAAETELQKSLKEELRLIDEVRSQYKKLTDAGVSRAVAMKTVTEQFGDSIEHINAVLKKNGLPEFNIKTFAGTDNPHEMMVMLKKQIDAARNVKNIKPEEISELEIKYSKIKVDAEAYDATKIKKGLDNELGRLKDEYELAVELDANPELGNMFADMFDIDLDTLPRTAKEYADRYTKSLNKYFKQMGANIELPNMLNLTRDDMMAFQEQVSDNKLQQVYFDMIQKGFDATHDALKKEISGEIKEYDKLLQKYSEYQYKLTQIAKNANQERKALVVQFGNDEQKERARSIYAKLEVEQDPSKAEELKRQLMSLVEQVVGDDKVKIQMKVAIDKEEAEKSAKASFEEFQKSPEWVTATGNLAGLTDKALGGLIDTIEEYKRKAKNLSPKQIKDINKALVNLEKERKKNNPFKLMSISILEAKDRMATFDEAIKDVEDEMDKLANNQTGDNLDETGEKILTLADRLRKLKKAREDAGNLDATEIVSNINAMVASVGQAVQMVNGLLDVLNGGNWSEAQELMNDTFSVIEKGGQGAAIGAQIGKGYGAIIGAVVGVGMGLFEALGDNYDKKVNAKIKDSEVVVKRLELAYVDLEHAIEKAYGTGEVGSKRLLASLKELELAELERQLALEQSRDNKHKDEGKIADIQKQIKELRYEIEDSITEITNDLLGTEAGSFAENLVSAMIESFRKGEDYMQVFEDKFDEMIDNMIMKSIVSRVVATYVDQLWDDMDARIKNRSQAESDALAAATKRRQELESMDVYEYGESQGIAAYGMKRIDSLREKYQKLLDSERDAARAAEEAARQNYEAASQMNDSDITNLISELAEIKPELGERLKEIFGEYYKFGETQDKELSALQQGIQGVSETTAGAIEAYLNGMSQQAYLRNDYLRQIVEMMSMQSDINDDAKIASLSQILLQLQTNYNVMMSMHSIMEGWSVPSGQGIRVELIS